MCQKTGAHFKLGELGMSLLVVAQTRTRDANEDSDYGMHTLAKP